jgi:hypothetical protein
MEDTLGGDIEQQVNVKLIKKGKEAYELFKSQLLKYNK